MWAGSSVKAVIASLSGMLGQMRRLPKCLTCIAMLRELYKCNQTNMQSANLILP